ncbi:MAG: UdgX family uracil-DNA binding protein, partial [Pseudomonadota bacterium]
AGKTVSARVAHPADYEGARDLLRRLLNAQIAPRDVTWRVGETGLELFDADVDAKRLPLPGPADSPRVPRSLAALAPLVVCHKSPDRFALVHRLLVRVQDEPALMRDACDRDVARAHTMEKNVRRCSHKMKAFVRFRATTDPDGGERYVAWFEPEHHTLDLTASFFVRRFSNMRWSILTPSRSAHWDTKALALGDGASRDIAPGGDVNEALWRTYFAAIFNPARLKVKAMQSEMPKRYWKNMPEADLIEPLIRSATGRSATMIEGQTRAPARSTRIARERAAEASAATAAPTDLATLATAAARCERCPLHANATQVVMGEGPIDAPLMFVGEQPGDQEDIAGKPFVGPAGQLFDRALAEAGIDRHSTFITNSVKHFKFEPRGKRRIHRNPTAGEIDHCRHWLDIERHLVRPRLTVALGASAARALAHKNVSVGKN